MTSPAPLPSLFGRFTSILKDHDRLGTTLRRLRGMCTALDSTARPLPPGLDPALLLEELEADLKEHFASEESPQYFGTVIDEAPALAPSIAALKWEHLSMLNQVGRLRAIAANEDRWSELSSATRQLVTELESHEQSESLLLRQLFRS